MSHRQGVDRSDRNDRGGGIHVLSVGWNSGLGPRKQLEALEALARTINQGVEGFFSALLLLRFGFWLPSADWYLGSLV